MRKTIPIMFTAILLSSVNSYSAINLNQLHERTKEDIQSEDKYNKKVSNNLQQMQNQSYSNYNQPNNRDIERLQEIVDNERSGADK